MQLLSGSLGATPRSDLLRKLANWLNPAVASPTAPHETVAALESLGPSLMPRTSQLQGVAMGLSVLGARATTGIVERLTRVAAPVDAPLHRVLATRAVIGGAGAAMRAVPERDGQELWVASLRSTGQLLRDGAAGAAVHDVGHWLQQRYPSRRVIRPVAVSAGSTAGLLLWASRRLSAREAAVDRWPLPQKTTLSAALATSYVVTAVGMGLTRDFAWSQRALESYFGSGSSKRLIARIVNAGLWAGAAAAAYYGGVAYIGAAHEKLETGYTSAPTTPLVSGGSESLIPYSELGQQGRRSVTDVVTPELIKLALQGLARAHPIRAHV